MRRLAQCIDTKRTLVDRIGESAIIGGGGPLTVGLIMIALGSAKWSGAWKGWRTSQSTGLAGAVLVIGRSPLSQILIGLGLCVAGGSLFVMFVFPSAPLVGAILGSVLIVVGVVFLIYRPRWIYPRWMRETTDANESG